MQVQYHKTVRILQDHHIGVKRANPLGMIQVGTLGAFTEECLHSFYTSLGAAANLSAGVQLLRQDPGDTATVLAAPPAGFSFFLSRIAFTYFADGGAADMYFWLSTVTAALGSPAIMWQCAVTHNEPMYTSEDWSPAKPVGDNRTLQIFANAADTAQVRMEVSGYWMPTLATRWTIP